jgi:hypothetical protein
MKRAQPSARPSHDELKSVVKQRVPRPPTPLVVERTNGWINRSRRLVRQYETSLAAHEGFLLLSQIALHLRRLDRGQLFDRL